MSSHIEEGRQAIRGQEDRTETDKTDRQRDLSRETSAVFTDATMEDMHNLTPKPAAYNIDTTARREAEISTQRRGSTWGGAGRAERGAYIGTQR